MASQDRTFNMTRLGKELRDEALELAEEFLVLVQIPSWARVKCYAKLAAAQASSSTDFVYDVANAIDILDSYVREEIKPKNFPQEIFDRLKDFYEEVKTELNYSSDEEKFNSDTMLSDDPQQGEEARREYPVGNTKGGESVGGNDNMREAAAVNEAVVGQNINRHSCKHSLQDDEENIANKRQKHGRRESAGAEDGELGAEEAIQGEDGDDAQSAESKAG